jgi:hypothetical protein
MAFTTSASLSQSTWTAHITNDDKDHCLDPWNVVQAVSSVDRRPIIGTSTRWSFDVEHDPPGSSRTATLRLSINATTEQNKLRSGDLILLVQYGDSATESLTVTLTSP